MVCDKKSYVTHGKMLNMAGQVIGAVVSGVLSDVYVSAFLCEINIIMKCQCYFVSLEHMFGLSANLVRINCLHNTFVTEYNCQCYQGPTM